MVALAASTLACGSMVRTPQVTQIQEIELVALRPDTLVFRLEALVHNPNPIAGEVHSGQMDLSVADAAAGSARIDGPFQLPGRGDATIAMEVSVPVENLRQNGAKWVAEDSLEIQWTGKFQVGVHGHDFTLAREGAQSLNFGDAVAQITQRLMGDVRWRVTGLRRLVLTTTPRADVTLEVDNPLPFDVTLEGGTIELGEGAEQLGVARLPSGVALAPQTTTEVTTQVTLKPLGLPGAVLGLLGGGRTPSVAGTLKVRCLGIAVDVPFGTPPSGTGAGASSAAGIP